MVLKTPKNRNYCAAVAHIQNHIELKGRDNIVHSTLFGNKVIIGKSCPIGTLGIYFPVETQLSTRFCYENNLYAESDSNKDKTKGYIHQKNRRIRAIQFGGHESNGLFLPLDCLKFTGDISYLKEGDEFDEINGIDLCQKYIPYNERMPANSTKKLKTKVKVFSRLVDNQFHLHIDTSHLGKNIHKFDLTDYISITEKVHGTSGVSANVLVKKKLNLFEKMLLKFGIKIETAHYDNEGIYSSRKVVKNAKEKDYTGPGYYGAKNDIWREADTIIRPVLKAGESVYYEIVGFLPTGGYIQKPYDYGCTKPIDNKFEYGKNFKIFIYRVTTTNVVGQVHELSAKQVQQWCVSNGLTPVPELFYGTVSEYLKSSEENWQETFLQKLAKNFWYNHCKMCVNKVPNEGVVIRKEVLGIEPYKYKSFQFLKHETQSLDAGELDIEEQLSDEEYN